MIKIEIFTCITAKESVSDMVDAVNDFIKNKTVRDIQYVGKNYNYSVMVVYEEKENGK